MELIALIVMLVFLVPLLRIEINTSKKLENDKKIMKQLESILEELRKLK